MRRFRLPSAIFLALAALALVGCDRLSQENFNKIERGMTYDEVVAILGEPTDSKSVGVASLSGTTATWESSSVEISIQFVNEKVQLKSRETKEPAASGN